jgi:hypothetical protein
MMLVIENDGSEIVSTNYWDTEYARKGQLYVSVNAGAFRLLLPPALEPALTDMRTAREVIVSRGPWPGKKPDAFELLFEDGSDAPYTLHFGAEQIDRAPAKIDEGRDGLLCTVWTAGLVKALTLPAAYRRVAKIPCLQPFERPGRH